jgi:hypothetical protein
MMSIGDRMNDFVPIFDASQCDRCARRLGPFTCEAYPEEIPMIMVTDNHDHRKPYFGDSGLQWVKAEVNWSDR